ncbi:MAG: ABC transporter ATP-binding protein [Fibrobacterota bacterium]
MIVVKSLSKIYSKKGSQIRALHEFDLTVSRGEWLTLTGPSGSGKSTLLNAVAGLIQPTSGQVLIDGVDLYALSKASRASFRGQKIGFVFQAFHLFPYLTVLQNVLAGGGRFSRDHASALRLLERVGLSDRAFHLPGELSVGEKQRVAVARAGFARPSIILADEPTGNLDAQNSRIVLDMLAELNRQGATLMLVTHKPEQDISAGSHRLLRLEKGTPVLFP